VESQEKAIEMMTKFAKELFFDEFNFLALMLSLLNRLDESKDEESAGLHNSLGIIENLLELVENQWVLDKIHSSSLVGWLMTRLKTVPPGAKVKNAGSTVFDKNMGNKLYATEILSMLVASSTHGSKFIEQILGAGHNNGLEILMRQAHFYKDVDPKDATESEIVQNVFNILCAVVRENGKARQKFMDLEGLQLMILMVRNKQQTRSLAVKVLANAMSLKGDPITHKMALLLVSKCLGLKCLCPLLVRGLKTKKFKKHGEKAALNISLSRQANMENILTIFTALFQELPKDGEEKMRLVQKFLENRCEKINRLLELHQLYLSQVNGFDKVLIANRRTVDENSYLERLENGLFSLQMTDYLIVDIAANGNDVIKDHLKKTIKMRNVKSPQIAAIVREYANELVPLPDETKEPTTTADRQIFANAEKIANQALNYAHLFSS